MCTNKTRIYINSTCFFIKFDFDLLNEICQQNQTENHNISVCDHRFVYIYVKKRKKSSQVF